MYYEINEETARRANDAYSMSDYRPGSATAEYRAAVDYAAALAQQQKAKVSAYYHGKLDSLVDSYARRLADWTNRHNRNTVSCPSVLICGGSNFPVAKKQRQNAREDTLWQEYQQIQAILDRIRTIGTGGVDFADPTARQQLEDQTAKLEEALSRGKAMNAHYRKQKTLQGFPGLTSVQAAAMDREILASVSFAQVPYPDYALASLRGKLKRARTRLEEYDHLHAAPAAQPATHFEIAFVSGDIVRNVEQNRLQLLFDTIPPEDLRARLKASGFRWSPKNQAWQRQLTPAAESAARRVLSLENSPSTFPAADATL